MSRTRIPGIDAFADLIDRLSVELLKLSFYEQAKREEQGKLIPNEKLVTKWDNLSRDSCEYRSLIKSAINDTLREIIESGEYKVLKELRTFRAPTKSVADLLDEMCMNTINSSLKEELVDAMKKDIMDFS